MINLNCGILFVQIIFISNSGLVTRCAKVNYNCIMEHRKFDNFFAHNSRHVYNTYLFNKNSPVIQQFVNFVEQS